MCADHTAAITGRGAAPALGCIRVLRVDEATQYWRSRQSSHVGRIKLQSHGMFSVLLSAVVVALQPTTRCHSSSLSTI